MVQERIVLPGRSTYKERASPELLSVCPYYLSSRRLQTKGLRSIRHGNLQIPLSLSNYLNAAQNFLEGLFEEVIPPPSVHF